MTLEQLEHLLRASAAITGCREIVVVGSQALLASYPDAPVGLLVSMDADLYPLHDADMADLIDGTIGELSPFHETFGYFAHGVGPETALLPESWMSRVVRIESANTGGAVGFCLSPVDLAVSKLLAGREKDVAFVREMLRARLVLREDVAAIGIELPEDRCRLLAERLRLL